MSEPPDDESTGLPKRNLPVPTRARAGEETGGASGTTPASPPPERRRGGAMRKVAWVGGAAVVLAIVIVILIFTIGKGDGTKPMANPLEVRELVARFDCTSSNPGTPSNVKVTAGQEVVKLGSGGCAVVGPAIAKVDRATKVEAKNNDNGCTVTVQSTAKYGGIVDRASVVSNGFARALVGGGYVLDLRARLYPPAKDEKLSIIFESDSQAACTTVANKLRRV